MADWKLNRKPKLTETETLLQEFLTRTSNMWHVGNSTPDKELGKSGDLYFDKETSDIYQRNNGWELQGSIKGDAGHNPVIVSSTIPEDCIEGDIWLKGDQLFVLTNSTWREITGKNGVNGTDGKDGKDAEPIIIRLNNKKIEWKHAQSGIWTPIFSLNDVVGSQGKAGKDGKDGREIELQKSATHLQWRYKGDKWKNLIALDELKGKIEYHGGGGGGGNVIVAGGGKPKGTNKQIQFNDNGSFGGSQMEYNDFTSVVEIVMPDQTETDTPAHDLYIIGGTGNGTGGGSNLAIASGRDSMNGGQSALILYGGTLTKGGSTVIAGGDGHTTGMAGGDVVLTPGGAGLGDQPGYIRLQLNDAGFYIAIDIHNITQNRMVVMPDNDGTVALETAASGSFTTVDSKTVTVVNGLITSISGGSTPTSDLLLETGDDLLLEINDKVLMEV